MDTDGLTADPPVAADSVMARLVDELAARLRAGGAVDVEAVIAESPQHADQLRGLLPALALLADLSRSSGESYGELVAPPAGGETGPDGVLGDYRILGEVGRGGMGVVYEAEQISLGRRVALKVLPFAATMDPRALVRFRNEAKAAASLRHEHIVHVYGVGCERGVHYYAMEFIDGQTLAQLINGLRSDGPGRSAAATLDYAPAAPEAPTKPIAALSTERSPRGRAARRQAAEWIAQAADALEHAHGLGIVHRDVKPGNLLLDAAGKVYVGDFGLARVGPDAGVTASGDLLGTLRYMAPEQAMARHGLADHRVDVYGLGATLYELLTGRPAVGGEDKADILRHIAFDEPVPPRKFDKAIPAELETITLKALAKNPTDRYATAGELADDLRRWLGDQTIKAKPPTLRQRVGNWSRRHKALVRSAAAMCALAILALAAGAVVVWKKEQQTAAAQSRAEDNLRHALAALDRVYLQVAEKRYPFQAKLDPADQALLRDVLGFYEQFARANANDPAVRYELAKAQQRVGELRKKLALDGWRASFDASVAILEPLVAEHPGRPEFRETLATGLWLNDKALAAAAIWDKLAAEFPDRFEYRRGQVYVRTRYTTPKGQAQNALELAERLVRDFPGEPTARLYLGECLNRRGTFAWDDNRYQVALRDYRAAQVVLEKLYAQSPDNDEYADVLGRNCKDLGETLALAMENYREGELYLRRAVELQEALVAKYASAPAIRIELAKSWEKLARMCHEEGRDDEAKHAARQSAKALDPLPAVPLYDKDRAHVSRWYRYLAQLLFDLGEPAEARRLAERSIQHARQMLPQLDPTMDEYRSDLARQIVHCFKLVGSIVEAECNTDQAEAAYGEAVAAAVETIARLQTAGWAFSLCGEFGNDELGLRLADRLLAATELRLGPDHPNTLSTISGLGNVFFKAGRHDRSVPLFERALAGQKVRLGPRHPETLWSMNNLASGYAKGGKLDLARQILEATLPLVKAEVGPNDKLTRQVTESLVAAYRETGTPDRIPPLYEAKYEARKAEFGPDHAITLESMAEFARAYLFVDRWQDAITLFEKVLESRTATLGPDHDDTRKSVFNLATAYERGKHLDRAERLLRDRLDDLRAKKTPKSEFTANVLARLGQIMLSKQKGPEAEVFLRECLAICDEILSEDWKQPFAKSLLGGSLLAQGQYAEAEPLLLKGYEGMKQREATMLPESKGNLVGAVKRIVRLYEATGQPDKAREWRKKLPPDPPAKPKP